MNFWTKGLNRKWMKELEKGTDCSYSSFVERQYSELMFVAIELAVSLIVISFVALGIQFGWF